jgi:phage shock protein PspC (stress-responsive transcriptional regulator)
MPEATNERPPWTRARSGRILFGVCAGFAARMGVSPWLVRVVLLIAAFVTAGLATVVYLVLALLWPLEPPAAEDGRP